MSTVFKVIYDIVVFTMSTKHEEKKYLIIYCKSILSVLEENCQFLLELAEEYQMDTVTELCCEYLSGNVQDTTCVKFYMIAERFRLDSLLKETLQQTKYLPWRTLDQDAYFNKLPDKTKLEICKTRIQELEKTLDRKSTRLNSSHVRTSRMPSSA